MKGGEIIKTAYDILVRQFSKERLDFNPAKEGWPIGEGIYTTIDMYEDYHKGERHISNLYTEGHLVRLNGVFALMLGRPAICHEVYDCDIAAVGPITGTQDIVTKIRNYMVRKYYFGNSLVYATNNGSIQFPVPSFSAQRPRRLLELLRGEIKRHMIEGPEEKMVHVWLDIAEDTVESYRPEFADVLADKIQELLVTETLEEP